MTDSVNPRTPDHANIMVEGPGGEFWYARVLGIFHANVRLAHEKEFSRVHVLWVRWYGKESSGRYCHEKMRQPRVGFIPHTEAAPFGFVDPRDVIRAVHLNPVFEKGKTTEYLPPSPATRSESEGNEDYKFYSLSM